LSRGKKGLLRGHPQHLIINYFFGPGFCFRNVRPVSFSIFFTNSWFPAGLPVRVDFFTPDKSCHPSGLLLSPYFPVDPLSVMLVDRMAGGGEYSFADGWNRLEVVIS